LQRNQTTGRFAVVGLIFIPTQLCNNYFCSIPFVCEAAPSGLKPDDPPAEPNVLPTLNALGIAAKADCLPEVEVAPNTGVWDGPAPAVFCAPNLNVNEGPEVDVDVAPEEPV
jgi:hypothetical protein